MLPLAFGASLLLLLASLSLQGLALESRLGQRRREARDLQEDALATASQRLVAELNLRHRCLLALPLQQWSRDGLPCASASEQQAVLRGGAGEARWQLIEWQPGDGRAELVIELEAQATGTPRRRGRFGVGLLSSDTLRALPPRFQALQGVAP